MSDVLVVCNTFLHILLLLLCCRKAGSSASGFRPVVNSDLTESPVQEPSFKPIAGCSETGIGREAGRLGCQSLDNIDGVPCDEDSHFTDQSNKVFRPVPLRPPAPPAPLPPPGRTTFSTKPPR